MITVANRRDVAAGIYVGRPSTLGNPYRIGVDGTREEVIAKYAAWLDHFLAYPESPEAKEFARLVDAARRGDVTLVCWCAPEPCHADVLKARIEAILGASGGG